MNLALRATTILLLISLALTAFSGIILPSASPVFARTLDEIQKDIEKQQKLLKDIQNQLASAQAGLNAAQSDLNSVAGEIPRLEAEIEQIEAEIKFNELQLQVLSEQHNLKTLEQEHRGREQDRALKHAYVNWRSDSVFGMFLLERDATNPLKGERYQSKVMGVEQASLEKLAEEILGIATEIDEFKSETEELEKKNKELEERKVQAQAQILALQNAVHAGAYAVGELRTNISVIQGSISQLSAEQKAIEDYNAWLLGQAGNGGSNPLQSGQFYFTGVGRDLYQGHGVGMSQYGAKGLADNGWSYVNILKHYYTNVEVVDYALSSDIYVHYCQGSPVFSDPINGCGGNGPAVTQKIKFNDYLAGLGEMPDSWPLEARKAQMVAARTYAVRYTNNGNPNNPICLTTRCQVSYIISGDKNEMDAVNATGTKVVTHQGQMIEAVYSADNNNGWGTAHNDTRFTDHAGNGTPVGYLRAVQENQSLVAKSQWTGWGWRTNGYSLNSGNASIKSMLNFARNDSGLTQGARNFINSIYQDIGQNISSITFERDPSGRVKKVNITGTNGQTRQIAGWFFTTAWNSWIHSNKPTGQDDYMFSNTFYLLQS